MEYKLMKEMWQETSLINQDGALHKMMQKMLQSALDAQFKKFIQADHFERTDQRNGVRNGSYNRKLNTRVGTIVLRVCRDREGNFKPDLFDRYQRSEKALVLTIVEMYLRGVSTRKVSAATEELCGFEISKSSVSDLVCKLDQDIEKWRMRPIVVVFKYLMVDARYEKIRENGRVISKAFVTVIGMTTDGYREIIGTWVINSESYEGWNSCFEELKKRGLSGTKFIVSDENAGLKSAIKKFFQDAQWQRCQVHFMRNFMSKLAKTGLPEGVRLLKDLFSAPTKNAALSRLETLREFLINQKRERVFQWLEESLEDTLAVYSLPIAHRKKMKSTNMLERLNSEMKRRSRVVRIFPNEASCLRLLTAICIEASEAWSQRRYLDMS